MLAILAMLARRGGARAAWLRLALLLHLLRCAPRRWALQVGTGKQAHRSGRKAGFPEVVARMTMSRSGLRVTAPTGFQLRVPARLNVAGCVSARLGRPHGDRRASIVSCPA